MTENEAIKILFGGIMPLNIHNSPVIHKRNQAYEIAIQAIKERQQYRELGTVEDIQKKMEELERWHTDRINENIKNPFAHTSTLICHNCDHKDEYIEELETQLEEFKALKENQRKCKDCAGCTNWKCDCANERDYAITEFAERLKDSLLHNYRHLLTVDTDGFEWLTTDAIDTHIDEIAEQMKEGD